MMIGSGAPSRIKGRTDQMTETSHLPGESQQKSRSEKRRRPTSLYRKLRRKLSKTELRAPITWLRHHSLVPADVIFASYPRSGTTWSRFTLFEILTGRPAGFEAVNSTICSIAAHTNGPRLLPGNGKFIASHEQFRGEYKRAIYLVRDARDVALSEFAYTRALEFFEGDFDRFLKTFLCGKISAFGPWQRHVTSWLDSPIVATGNLLVVRFEDLRQNPREGFARMAEFLGVSVDEDRIRQAIANNSLDKMKEKEEAEPQRASVKGRFVRGGAVQGWRGKLTPAQVELIERHAGSALSRLGYPVPSRTLEPEVGAEALA
jgi:hypothetical protein